MSEEGEDEDSTGRLRGGGARRGESGWGAAITVRSSLEWRGELSVLLEVASIFIRI